MLERWLVDIPWLASLLWAGLFCSDYFLTLWGARLYLANGARYFAFEGSYELTPQYQADINRQRHFSRRWFLSLFAGIVILNGYWYLAVYGARLPEAYLVVAGALLLLLLAVHVRHFRNVVTFSLYAASGRVSGQITYSRSLILLMSATELLAFGLFYLVLAAFFSSALAVGGASGCLVTAGRHYRQARKQPEIPAASATP